MHKADFIISEIFVYSIAGKEVFHNNPKNNAGNTCINLSDLPPGFYVIKITENSDKSYTVPLVLKQENVTKMQESYADFKGQVLC